MSKSRRSQRSAGRNTNNYEYKKEVSCKDNYLSDKHKEAREEFIKNNPIVPMNPKQRKYMEMLEDKKCIIACGLAGTSKTYIPTATFADWYRTGKIDKIVLVRPAVSNSKSLGFFAGSLETKASIWLAPILDVLHRRLGKAVTMLAIEKGDIEADFQIACKQLAYEFAITNSPYKIGDIVTDYAGSLRIEKVKVQTFVS